MTTILFSAGLLFGGISFAAGGSFATPNVYSFVGVGDQLAKGGVSCTQQRCNGGMDHPDYDYTLKCFKIDGVWECWDKEGNVVHPPQAQADPINETQTAQPSGNGGFLGGDYAALTLEPKPLCGVDEWDCFYSKQPIKNGVVDGIIGQQAGAICDICKFFNSTSGTCRFCTFY